MTDTLLERATQLIQHGRYTDAENDLKTVLASDPMNVDAIVLLSICKAETGDFKGAIELIKQAISRTPDHDYYLFLCASFHFRNSELEQAEKFIKNAIAYRPDQANYFGLYAHIKLARKDWEEALTLANKGLDLDPEDLACLNVRATALSKLDRHDESYITISEALNQDPENDYTHTNLGWNLLERGDHKKALEHFREALKINPGNDYAKAGLVEGLKARYFVYRIFMKYAFFVGNLKAKGQWALILGMYFGVRFLKVIASNNDGLSLFLTPIIYLYFAFAISTWLIDPFSNLLLRLNVYGKYALTKEETMSSNFVGVSLLLALLSLATYLIFNSGPFILSAAYFGVMMIPLASMFNPVKEKNKKILIAYTALLAIVGLSGIVLFTDPIGPTLWTAFLIGIFAYQWIANALIIR